MICGVIGLLWLTFAYQGNTLAEQTTITIFLILMGVMLSIEGVVIYHCAKEYNKNLESEATLNT
jgi:hypothetical protein